MKYHISFELKGLPKTVNQLGRKHWAIKVKHNNEWHLQILAELMKQGLPPHPITKAFVTLTRFSAVEPDYDNLVNSFKCILDSLIKASVLADDSSRVIGHPIYMWEKCPHREGKIRVEVQER